MNGCRFNQNRRAYSRHWSGTRLVAFARVVLHRFDAREAVWPAKLSFRRVPASLRLHTCRLHLTRIDMGNSIALSLNTSVYRRTTGKRMSIPGIRTSFEYRELPAPRPVVEYPGALPVEQKVKREIRASVGTEQAAVERALTKGNGQAQENQDVTPAAPRTDDEGAIQRVADKVIQSIDKRVIARRERLGFN